MDGQQRRKSAGGREKMEKGVMRADQEVGYELFEHKVSELLL